MRPIPDVIQRSCYLKSRYSSSPPRTACNVDKQGHCLSVCNVFCNVLWLPHFALSPSYASKDAQYMTDWVITKANVGVRVCVYVCIYIYICVFVCICVYIYICVFVCICVYIYICIYMYIYVYIYMYIYICCWAWMVRIDIVLGQICAYYCACVHFCFFPAIFITLRPTVKHSQPKLPACAGATVSLSGWRSSFRKMLVWCKYIQYIYLKRFKSHFYYVVLLSVWGKTHFILYT